MDKKGLGQGQGQVQGKGQGQGFFPERRTLLGWVQRLC